MITYTITYDDGRVKVSGQLNCPERLPQAGDVYVATRHFYTLGDISYHPGDTFEILDRTSKTPHHRLSSLGNLVIRCKSKTSVWTNFEACVAEGWLELAGSNVDPERVKIILAALARVRLRGDC